MMNDEEFKLLDGVDKQTDMHLCIYDCRFAFATEKIAVYIGGIMIQIDLWPKSM